MCSAGTCKNIEHVQEKYMFYIIFKTDLLGGCYILFVSNCPASLNIGQKIEEKQANIAEKWAK